MRKMGGGGGGGWGVMILRDSLCNELILYIYISDASLSDRTGIRIGG